MILNISADNKVNLIVQSEPDYPPFCIVDEKGNAAGFSVDLFRAAAEIMGYEVEFQVGSWNEIKNNLAEGKIDALPLVGRSPEREKIYDFTVPYHKLNGAVFVRKNSKKIIKYEDLDGAAILVMKGDNADEYTSRTFKNATIVRTDTFESAFNQLSKGNGDAVIAQKLMGQELLKLLELKGITTLNIPLEGFAQDFSFAVKKGDSELLAHLNEGLVLLNSNGTYEKLYKKWFYRQLPEMNFNDIVKVFLPVILAIVILIFVFAVIYLEIRVKNRTKSLRAEVAERKKAEQEIKQQLEERGILLREVHHRIKNNFTIIESFINLSSRNHENHEVKKALEVTSSRVSSMRVLYEKLLLDDTYKEISVEDYVKPLITEIITFFASDKDISLITKIDDILLDTKSMFYIGIILNEIVTNSMKYAFPEKNIGTIEIQIEYEGNQFLKIKVKDDGVGLTNSTTELKTGFGTTIIEMLCKQMNGHYHIQNNNGVENIIELSI
ncbi:MAG: transporter substrate-binding domain-containing protein [Spirochaetales bacterium]|nr:transporter substrate-binding domain-containing protein [Spirochaetales bacterium]